MTTTPDLTDAQEAARAAGVPVGEYRMISEPVDRWVGSEQDGHWVQVTARRIERLLPTVDRRYPHFCWQMVAYWSGSGWVCP